MPLARLSRAQVAVSLTAAFRVSRRAVRRTGFVAGLSSGSGVGAEAAAASASATVIWSFTFFTPAVSLASLNAS